MPFEMITMLGSTVLGGVMSIWSQSIKAKQAEQRLIESRERSILGLSEGALTSFYGSATPEQREELTSGTMLKIESSETPTVIEPTFKTPERQVGETASKYHARVMREEIAFEQAQPYKQVGPVRTYREYGVVHDVDKIEGYEGLEREQPLSEFGTFYSKQIKAPVARTFFPDVREVREAERLGAKVTGQQKFRAEVQKAIPTFFISAGVSAGVGAGMSLLPSAIQAMKIRTALILGIPAGVGIYKGIKEKE